MTAPANPGPTDAELRAAALLAARLGGCNCQPDITIRRQDGIAFANVAHDDDCPCAWMRAPAGGA